MSQRGQVQFSVRALLLLVIAASLLGVVVRSLMRLPTGAAFGILVALTVGTVAGIAVSLILKMAREGRASVYALLVATVAFAGFWLAGHFLSYLVGLFVGAVATQFGLARLNDLARLAGLTIRHGGHRNDERIK